MALIKCPECNKEISDRADACIHCGCPISNKSDLMKIILLKVSEERVKTLELIIEITDLDFIQSKQIMKTVPCTIVDGLSNSSAEKIAKMFIKLGNEVCIQYSLLKSENNVLAKIKEKKERLEKEKLETEKKEDMGKIKCPTCSSTNVTRISAGEKVTNVALFGLFGNKRKMQFKCNDCKYMW